MFRKRYSQWLLIGGLAIAPLSPRFEQVAQAARISLSDLLARIAVLEEQVLPGGGATFSGDVIANGDVDVAGNLQAHEKVLAAGGIQVGPVSEDATSETEGTLRWNNQSLELSNGAEWQPMKTGRSVPVIWSGGSTSHGRYSGWQTYPTDGVDFNTAGDHLDVSPSGLITVIQPGFYRVNFWSITRPEQGYASNRVEIRRNGTRIHSGYSGGEATNPGDWMDIRADLTWHFDAGDIIEVQVFSHNPAGYAYHRWQNGQSRLQISYVGPSS